MQQTPRADLELLREKQGLYQQAEMVLQNTGVLALSFSSFLAASRQGY